MTEEETTITQTEDKKSTRTKKQYVLPHERGWQVKLEGSSKATKVFNAIFSPNWSMAYSVPLLSL